MIETWKDIAGYEGKYQVSNLGNVKSLDRPINKKGVILKASINSSTYLGIVLYDGLTKKSFNIHRLVALAFIENDINERNQVNHKDGNRLNNYFENLEWVTSLENSSHGKLKEKTTSRYLGVYWNKKDKKWVSQIRIGKLKKHLGGFNNEIDAYNARVKFEKENLIINKYL